nr:N-acetylgalactosamine 6-sulfate sulfatase [Verrucomicrobiota bacterium]
VRAGDWKLIRWFDPAAPRELYDLRADLGETKNLAGAQAGKVKELDALIDTFLATTGALFPRPNPAFKATQPTAAKPLAPDDGTGVIAGWKLRGLKAATTSDGVRLEGVGRASFLGTAKYRFSGAAEVRLRVRAPAGGQGEVHWRLADQSEFSPEQVAKLDFPAGDDWHDLTAAVPSQGNVVQLRLYLPAGQGPVELSAIDVRAGSNPSKAKPRQK